MTFARAIVYNKHILFALFLIKIRRLWTS